MGVKIDKMMMKPTSQNVIPAFIVDFFFFFNIKSIEVTCEGKIFLNPLTVHDLVPSMQ